MNPTDTEILDWLEKNFEGYGDRGIRFFRVHKTTYSDAMKNGL